WSGSDATPHGSGRGGRRREIELEREPRPQMWPRFHSQLRAHGADQLAANRQPQARAGEVETWARRRFPERRVERPHLGCDDALAAVSDRELEEIGRASCRERVSIEGGCGDA